MERGRDSHLSRITQDPRYDSAVRAMYSKLFQLPTFDGLFPDSISLPIDSNIHSLI